MFITRVALIVMIVHSGLCSQNLKEPVKPRFTNYTSVTSPSQPRYYNSSLHQAPSIPTQTSAGMTAEGVARQTNLQAMQSMGYQPAVVPPSDQQLAHQFILQQYNSGQYSQRLRQHQELLNILNEAGTSENRKRSNAEYYKSQEFAIKSKSFTDALKSIKAMLYGQKPLSVKTAFYNVESAYGNAYLSRKEYENTIKESANFIRTWLKQNGFNSNNNEALHAGIQKFMKDTLSINIPAIPDSKEPACTITHFPFKYDYDDFKGERDHRNYFVTKTLATGYGQCNGLPDVYIAISEELGAKVYLSFAPQHSLVKYPDNNGNLHNYEPTSHWNISDNWYKEHLFISSEAERSGIYLDTLNKRMIVANSVLDLAFAYLRVYGAADGSFINECINTAEIFYPKKNNIYVYFIKSSLLARQLEHLLYENKITDLKNIGKVPGAHELYEQLKKNEEIITMLGYQDMPPSMYEEMMKRHEDRGNNQQANQVKAKEKRNLFKTSH